MAVLAGTVCHCAFPTTYFTLHEREDEQLCAQKCSGEEFESCGTPDYFIVYQTQVQGGTADALQYIFLNLMGHYGALSACVLHIHF